jgi:hypothetical protein
MSYSTSSLWQVIDAVWDMLEAHTDFATLVPAANRVKFTDTIDRNPDLDVPAEDDYVRVRIQPSDIVPWAYRTSNGSMMTLVLSIDMHAGDRRVHIWSEPVEAIYKAFTNWKTYLTGTHWSGDDFNVCRCRLVQVQDQMGEERATTGWVSRLNAEIDIWYQSTDINGT